MKNQEWERDWQARCDDLWFGVLDDGSFVASAIVGGRVIRVGAETAGELLAELAGEIAALDAQGQSYRTPTQRMWDR